MQAARMRRRQKIIQAQVEEQLQLEHVIKEQAQMRQAQVEHTEVEQLIPEQARVEEAQVEQQGWEGQVDGTAEPLQEDTAAANTSPAPYLVSRCIKHTHTHTHTPREKGYAS